MDPPGLRQEPAELRDQGRGHRSAARDDAAQRGQLDLTLLRVLREAVQQGRRGGGTVVQPLPQRPEQELLGLAVFNGKGNCAACHPSQGKSPLFTDFTNDNLGVPKNASNPFYTQSATINPDGVNFIDKGLGTTLGDSAFDGRFKVPSLRNVAVTAPYMHNGVFTSLRQVVQFYNSACAAGNPDGWAAAEVAENRNCKELGDLGLADNEIDALVAFLETLTDGYVH